MREKGPARFAGVDGCRKGWVVAACSFGRANKLKLDDLCTVERFDRLVEKLAGLNLICVDIPIGLNKAGGRECDRLARKILGAPRASSVFESPVRAVLTAGDYGSANSINRAMSNKGLSRQSFNILARIREVDELITPTLQKRIREIHPEISFWAINNQRPMRFWKKTVEGQRQRHRLLKRVFERLDNPEGLAQKLSIGIDDVLDSLVAAWTAGQVLKGKFYTLPAKPNLDSNGLRMEIICPIVDRSF